MYVNEPGDTGLRGPNGEAGLPGTKGGKGDQGDYTINFLLLIVFSKDHLVWKERRVVVDQ